MRDRCTSTVRSLIPRSYAMRRSGSFLPSSSVFEPSLCPRASPFPGKRNWEGQRQRRRNRPWKPGGRSQRPSARAKARQFGLSRQKPGKSPLECNCVVGLGGLELGAKHAVLSNESPTRPLLRACHRAPPRPQSRRWARAVKFDVMAESSIFPSGTDVGRSISAGGQSWRCRFPGVTSPQPFTRRAFRTSRSSRPFLRHSWR
jgi:hypothetical protein